MKVISSTVELWSKTCLALGRSRGSFVNICSKKGFERAKGTSQELQTHEPEHS